MSPQVSEIITGYRQARARLMGPMPPKPPPILKTELPSLSPPLAPPPASPRELTQPCTNAEDLRRALLPILTISRIQQIVANHFGIARWDILSESRTANVVRPRQIAMYLAKTLALRSLPEIGRRFSGRDHTTILHGVRKVSAMVAADPAFAAEVESLRCEIVGAVQNERREVLSAIGPDCQ